MTGCKKRLDTRAHVPFKTYLRSPTQNRPQEENNQSPLLFGRSRHTHTICLVSPWQFQVLRRKISWQSQVRRILLRFSCGDKSFASVFLHRIHESRVYAPISLPYVTLMQTRRFFFLFSAEKLCCPFTHESRAKLFFPINFCEG